jgi:hypothetical protein
MSQGNRIARHRARQGRPLRGGGPRQQESGTKVRVGIPPGHAMRYEYPIGSDLVGWQVGTIGLIVIYVDDEETASRLRDYLQEQDDHWRRLGGPNGGRR